MKIRCSLALAICGAMVAGGAQAGGNVYWSIGITAPPVGTVISNAPGYYYAPAPLYAYPPQVVYAPPPRVYYHPPTVVYERAPQVVYERPVRVYRHHRRHWDRDRDGIPDRYDRYDNRQDWVDRGHHWQHSYGVADGRRYGY